MTVSLAKKVEAVDNVAFARGFPDIKVAVKCAIDVSISMEDEFRDGIVQEVTDRFLAVGVRFDDNQSIEMYAYGTDARRLRDVTPEQFGSYINRTFIPEAQNAGVWMSGTNYGRAFALVAKDTKPKFFGFGKKSAPSLLLFQTDGDTADEAGAEAQLVKLGEQNVYVQLIGVGTNRFSWLQRMADKYEHVGFITIPNLRVVSDEQLYEQLLTKELATWLRKF